MSIRRRIALASSVIFMGGALLGCSSDRSPPPPATQKLKVTASIGPEGGVITHPSGAAIRIPAGAVAELTSFSVENVDPPAEGVLHAKPVTQGFILMPEGVSFREPVSLALPLDSTLIHAVDDPGTLRVLTAARGSSAFAALSAVVNVEARIISAETLHFSAFTGARVANPLAITTPRMLTDATLDAPHSVTFRATQPMPRQPYFWTAGTGTPLPPGLSITPAGVLSGVPTLPGRYTFTVQVVDSDTPPNRAEGAFSLRVVGGVPEPDAGVRDATPPDVPDMPGHDDAQADAGLDAEVRDNSTLDDGGAGADAAPIDARADAAQAETGSQDRSIDATVDAGIDAAVPDARADGGPSDGSADFTVFPSWKPVRRASGLIQLETPFTFDPQAVVRVDTVRLEPAGRTPQTIWIDVPLQLMGTVHNAEITVTPGPNGRNGPVLLDIRPRLPGEISIGGGNPSMGLLPPDRPPVTFSIGGSGYGFDGRAPLSVTYCGRGGGGMAIGGIIYLTPCWGEWGDSARTFPIQAMSINRTPPLESEIILFPIGLPPGNPQPHLEDSFPPRTYPSVGVGTGDYLIQLLTWAYFVPGTVITASKGAVSRSFIDVCNLGRGPCSITVPAELLQTPGTVTFAATAPPPGGGTGRPTRLDVLAGNPTPQIARAAPASFRRNGPGGTVTLFGSGFNASSFVSEVGSGARLAILSFTSTQIQATVPAAAVAGVLSVRFTVTNPAPAGGTTALWEIPVN